MRVVDAGSPAPAPVDRVDTSPVETLEVTLRRALAAKGPTYQPRTHHLHSDGRPTFVNRLILETSPYLLQHAHNPVNWYPWGDEAFETAKRENKPVLLSIGYSTCHWCHVMERESFEDTEIAAYINAHFIAIKVDREERPDIDDIYMLAVQMMTGRGGWPMNTVLTPDRRPFFGGTYFPARDGDRGARKGFLTILRELRAEFESDPEAVVRRAQQISQRIQTASQPTQPGGVPGASAIHDVVRALAGSYDSIWGGFGQAPKFPSPVNLELLLRYHRRTGDAQARTMVMHTLDRMAAGGLYDHVGGGFHRYATDAQWLVPHFEKMLYDNAQLVALYLDAYQVSGDEDLARVARETLDYVRREMTSPEGGFFSATDADSPVPGKGHEEEGWFFTWTPSEIHEAAGAELAPLVIAAYGVTELGNFEGRNILHLPRSLSETAATLSMTADSLRDALWRARERLYQVRLRRPAPLKDEKIIVSWNGLMISAFARGALVLGRDDDARAAEKAADFVLSNMLAEDGRLLRTFKDGRARHNGVLDDYAFLIQGLLDLHDVTSEQRWLREALKLQAVLDRRHGDPKAGGYFMTGDGQDDLLARGKPAYDGAEPSGNSIALMNLLRLGELTGDEAHRRRAERGFAAFSQSLTRGGRGATKMLSALDFYLDSPLEVAIVTPGATAEGQPLLDQVRRTYLPNRTLTITAAGDELTERAKLMPQLEGKLAIGGKPTAFVCEGGQCERPTSEPSVLRKQLAKVRPLELRPSAR